MKILLKLKKQFERRRRHPDYQHYAECADRLIHLFSGKQLPFGSALKPNAGGIKPRRELCDDYLPLFDNKYFELAAMNPGS